MQLSPSLSEAYTHEHLSAREAQRLAEYIAWGPVIFQVARVMLKHGIFEMLRDSEGGLTAQEVADKAKLSLYAAKCLLEASLSAGTVLLDAPSARYTLSKTGWFLLNDPATRVNIDFNHDVNYEGWFRLEDALLSGKPEGLKHFGPWPTIYEGLHSLPQNALHSWLAFDHFYSDSAFPEALKIVFDQHHVRSLYDVGGNTGKWALRCVAYNSDVNVTVLDLPQQIEMMRQNIHGTPGESRIKGYGINLLDEQQHFPATQGGPDAIWMSQFLDCFSMPQIVSILQRAREVMTEGTRVFVLETLWDRQKYEPAALCLTMTSLYFTAMANGNSKMYGTDELRQCIKDAGLEIENIYDHLGQGHSLLVLKAK